MSKRAPELLTNEEREGLATFFEKKARTLQAVLAGCEGMRLAYPGLADDGRFILLYQTARDGMKSAEELAAYIRIATDEQFD